MTQINNLGDATEGTLMAESQATKATTSNSLDNLLSDATQKLLSKTITGNTTLDDDEFFGSFFFDLDGSPASNFSLFSPASGNHTYAVRNATGKVATIDITGSPGTSATLSDGATGIFHSNGTNVVGQTTDVRGLQTIWVPAAAMQPTVTDGCATLANIEVAATKPDQHVLAFVTSSNKHAQFEVAFPKSWDKETITYRVFWTHQGGQTGGLDGVAWSLQAVSLSDDDPFNTTYGTAVAITDDKATGDDLFVTSVSAAVTVAGTLAEGNLTFFRIFRDVSDGADDLDIDAQLVGVQVFYTIDAGTDD